MWTVEVEKAGEYDVWLDWACADESAGNAYVLEGGKEPLRGKVKATGGWDKYRQEKVGTVTLAAGTQRLTLRPDGELRRALMDLRRFGWWHRGRSQAIHQPVDIGETSASSSHKECLSH